MSDLPRRLVSHHGLARPVHPPGAEGVRALLAARRCIQLDPLDTIGTNPDLVAIARLDGVSRGDVYRHLLPGHAFEHFAKERCLLPPAVFPRYREHARQVPGWRQHGRLKRLPPGVLDAVLAEVQARGPVTADELADHGRVEPVDWSGWKGTSKAATLALRVLALQCRVVVCGRTSRGKRYDVPERALPTAHDAAPEDADAAFALDLAEAAGMLPEAVGPWWGPLRKRKGPLVERLVADGRLERIGIPGTRRTWLTVAGWRDRPVHEPDDRLRVLGPLDPLLWDRDLVRRLFGFDYVWEVYKPAAQRRWGWYVCPLLHRGALVGRIEAHTEDGRAVVDRLWEESPGAVDQAALDVALERLAVG